MPPELAVYKAEALIALDRDKEAHDYLDPIVPQLRDDDFARAERLWAEILLRQGWLDGAILSAEGASRAPALADLQTAWGRADTERRRQANEYWWLLAAFGKAKPNWRKTGSARRLRRRQFGGAEADWAD